MSYAFLLALEALTPQQRAVLLLRDVFDYSVAETAEALGLSEPNVKTTHHRARRAMRAYDQQRCVPTRALQERTRAALEQLLVGLMNRDVAAIEALLADDVRSLSDGGGEFAAAHNPVDGQAPGHASGPRPDQPQRLDACGRGAHGERTAGAVGEFGTPGPRFAPCGIVRCEVDAAGRNLACCRADLRAVPLDMTLALQRSTGCRLDGYRPAVISGDDVRAAEIVVAIDTELPSHLPPGGSTAEVWQGFPPMREQYLPSRKALMARVEALVERLAAGTAPPSPR